MSFDKDQGNRKRHFMFNMNLLLKTSRNASTAKAILMNRAKISSVDLNKMRGKKEREWEDGMDDKGKDGWKVKQEKRLNEPGSGNKSIRSDWIRSNHQSFSPSLPLSFFPLLLYWLFLLSISPASTFT